LHRFAFIPQNAALVGGPYIERVVDALAVDYGLAAGVSLFKPPILDDSDDDSSGEKKTKNFSITFELFPSSRRNTRASLFAILIATTDWK
jgi:hypothetical protein